MKELNFDQTRQNVGLFTGLQPDYLVGSANDIEMALARKGAKLAQKALQGRRCNNEQQNE